MRFNNSRIGAINMKISKQVVTVAALVIAANSAVALAATTTTTTVATKTTTATTTPTAPTTTTVATKTTTTTSTPIATAPVPVQLYPGRATSAEDEDRNDEGVRHEDVHSHHGKKEHDNDEPLQLVATLSGNTLTVTAASRADLKIGTILSGAGIPPGTTIIAFVGGRGGVGTYTVSIPTSSTQTAVK
jgi:New glue protein family